MNAPAVVSVALSIATCFSPFVNAVAAEQPNLEQIRVSDDRSGFVEADSGNRFVPLDVVQNFIEHGRRHPDGIAAFSIEMTHWKHGTDVTNVVGAEDGPIGVFDSGIGGLTVLEAILTLDAFDNETLRPGSDGRRDFENERFVYFGDQANMPYGNYPSANRQDYLKELVLKDAAFLLGRRYWPASGADEPAFDKPPVKAIVIACNTATAWGLEEIREVIAAWHVPVIVVGVVEAGARGVTELSDVGGEPRTIAVLATVGTCSSNAYPKAIGRAVGLAGRKVPRIIQRGSVCLAGAIEGDSSFVVVSGVTVAENAPPYLGPGELNTSATLDGSLMPLYGFESDGLLVDPSKPASLRLNSVENYVRYEVATLMEDYRTAAGGEPIDTVVLGCTHFPLVEQEILAAFARLRSLELDGTQPYKNLIAETIDVIDPAEMTAKALFRELSQARLGHAKRSDRDSVSDLFFISVPNPMSAEAKFAADGGLDRDYKYSRQAGRLDVEDTLCVPMRVSLLPVSSVHLIQSRLPEVWNRLQQSP